MTDENADSETNNATQSQRIVYEIDSSERPSEAVVRAVATLTDTPVLDLDPLYRTIDPGHLDGILNDRENGRTVEESSISFVFNGCRVTVNQNSVRVQNEGD
ncbi:HalOD1 output domain-containing protein [Halomontanus rarus]|uniref:HalOD1 output domain-containing protein n=1 Tax=Halomontanus rarus TaxID=3034020 RepID=UPI001A9A03BD